MPRLQQIVASIGDGRNFICAWDAGKDHLRMQVLNPETGEWWEAAFTKVGEVGHG